MASFALQSEIRACIQEMNKTASYLDQAADKLEASLQGLGDMKICRRMRSDANDYRKAATELSRALR